MKKVSISVCTFQKKFGDKGALEVAAEIGADAVDFDLSSRSRAKIDEEKTEEELTAYYTGLYEYAKQLGIEIGQTHGRTRSFSNDPIEDAAIMERIRKECLITKALRAKYCVIHNVSNVVMGANADPSLMHDIGFSVYNQILGYAKQYGIRVLTETFGAYNWNSCDFFGDAYEFKKLYDRICSEGDNANHFGICIDTGHSNMATRFSNPSVPDVIRMMGKDIYCLHLNDNDRFSDQHHMPMAGTLDWNKVLDALDEVGYSGTYNLEVNLSSFGVGFEKETAAFAIKQLKFMLDQHTSRR